MVQMLNEKPKLQQLTIKPFTIGGYEIRSCENGAYCVFVKEENKMSKTNLDFLIEEGHPIGEQLCDLNEESNSFDYCDLANCPDCHVRNLLWLLEKHKEPILDDIEKEYLSAVIKPFREKIECIFKAKFPNFDEYYIVVGLKDNDSLRFPRFKGNTMYKGMKLSKHYTLEELGL